MNKDDVSERDQNARKLLAAPIIFFFGSPAQMLHARGEVRVARASNGNSQIIDIYSQDDDAQPEDWSNQADSEPLGLIS
jgi:hypothetical protein